MLSFSSVETLDRLSYRAHVKESGFFTKSCEYAYANIYAWTAMYQTKWASGGGSMYFRMRHEDEDYFLCPVTALSNFENALAVLTEYEKKRGREALHFVCLPKDFAEKLKELRPEVTLEENRDGADYLYEREKLASFSGKALHAKKNHKNRFLALYGDSYEYRVMTPDDVPLCKAFNEKWYAANRAYTDFEFSNEHIATTKLLDHFESLGLVGGLIFVGGELRAYTLASDNYDGADTLDVHTEKGDYDTVGVYPTVCSEFLLHSGSAYRYVNREDDVGDEGLRQSKLSYKPVAMEEKYNASLML